ncbi:MAG: hypothetical protein JWR58_2622 [Pseudonocardia sp.]|jgi:hypothetical protein|nr:hypothetical protein [Pseudonocardia sp.]
MTFRAAQAPTPGRGKLRMEAAPEHSVHRIRGVPGLVCALRPTRGGSTRVVWAWW